MLAGLAGHPHHVAVERELFEADLARRQLWVEQLGPVFLDVFSYLHVRNCIDRTRPALVREQTCLQLVTLSPDFRILRLELLRVPQLKQVHVDVERIV